MGNWRFPSAIPERSRRKEKRGKTSTGEKVEEL